MWGTQLDVAFIRSGYSNQQKNTYPRNSVSWILVGNDNQIAADLYLIIYNLLLKYRINIPLEN